MPTSEPRVLLLFKTEDECSLESKTGDCLPYLSAKTKPTEYVLFCFKVCLLYSPYVNSSSSVLFPTLSLKSKSVGICFPSTKFP